MPTNVTLQDGTRLTLEGDLSPDQASQRVSAFRVQTRPGVKPPVPQGLQGPASNQYKADPNDVGADVRLGRMVPQSAIPGLSAINKYAVQPFEKAGQAGAAFGGSVLEGGVAGALKPYSTDPIRDLSKTREQYPGTTGIARAVGQVVGSTIADPRNWPLFMMGGGEARPILSKVFSTGFGLQMGGASYQSAKDLHENWDRYTPTQRYELATSAGLTAVMSAGALAHAGGGEAKTADLKNKVGENTKITPDQAAEIPKARDVRTFQQDIDEARTLNAALGQGKLQTSYESSRRSEDTREAARRAGPLSQELGINAKTPQSSEVPPSSKVGREAGQSPSPEPTKEPFQASTPATRPGEPVPTTPRSEIGGMRASDPSAMESINRDLERRGISAPGKDLGRRVGDIVGTKEGAEADTNFFQKAKEELGPQASISDVAQRAQALKDASDSPRSMRGDDFSRPPRIPDVNDPERGSLSLRKRKQQDQRFDDAISSLQTSLKALTTQIESSLRATPPDDTRMRTAERVADLASQGMDKAQSTLAKIKAQSIAIKDSYLREPEWTDYKDAVGRFSGTLGRNAWTLRKYTEAIKEKIPDVKRREAITNWIQAGGDDAILASRATKLKGQLRAGYERARTLTPEEKAQAQMIAEHFDTRLQEAIDLGILDHGLENYVPQVWKAKDVPGVQSYFSTLTRSGTLKPDFNSAKHRIYDSYFEGEQAGRTPVNKDIGFLVASWEKSFNNAMASRAFIKHLTNGTASDGRPIVAQSGVGKAIYEDVTGRPTIDPQAYMIFPKAGKEEVGDYRSIDHPALTKWTWATKDNNGAPIMMKGDLRVHPEFRDKLDNLVNRGRWSAEHPIQTSVLKGQAFFKQTLLAASPFHQVQEGFHALLHGINPFKPDQINISDPVTSKLLDHGLVIGSYDSLAAFEEGVTSGGAVHKLGQLIPLPNETFNKVMNKSGMDARMQSRNFGEFLQKHNDYLFQDYIPRLKTKMAVTAYNRNMKAYSEHVADGRITTNQIAAMTASQANAAFGELNYMLLGRNPQTQAMLRFAFLAPDFLEARARFLGQALKPYGKEQSTALFLRGILGMYTGARILNQLVDNDPHWDKPFSVVYKGQEYQIRSMPGDIWHLLEDPGSFIYHRVNPSLVKPGIEMMTGHDDFGRKRDFGQRMMDFVRGVLPIWSQGMTKSGGRDPLSGALQSVGITRSVHRTEAASLAHQYALEDMPSDITSHNVMRMVNDIETGNFDPVKYRTLVAEGKMNQRDYDEAKKLSRMPELYRDFHRLPTEQKVKVWNKMSPEEQHIVKRWSTREAIDPSLLLPEQRAQYYQDLADQQSKDSNWTWMNTLRSHIFTGRNPSQ